MFNCAGASLLILMSLGECDAPFHADALRSSENEILALSGISRRTFQTFEAKPNSKTFVANEAPSIDVSIVIPEYFPLLPTVESWHSRVSKVTFSA